MSSRLQLRLPIEGGTLEEYTVSSETPLPVEIGLGFHSRVAYAAAHVVVDPLATRDPVNGAAIDWRPTLAFRRQLWAQGFGVAEAMDTAQRGMGLDWAGARELIRHACAEARTERAAIACGANTDQLDPTQTHSLEAVTAAYEEQCGVIEDCGGRIILMASRALAKCAKTADDYARVYGSILSQVRQPAILHWLGEAFDPSLRGYWGGGSTDESMGTCLSIIEANRANIDGVKISLLAPAREVEMRRKLPSGVRMYTGDDFHYPELIAGDQAGYSDALLGIFDAIAPAAAAAFRALDAGDSDRYRQLLDPTLALSRHIFQAPTYYYKTGLVFLSYLNGYQDHFHMLGGQQSARSISHLASLFRHADRARLLINQELAVARMRNVLMLAGIE
ncbi:MAG TPA: dihydrodipicolinate synthase family protein [Bryobacteraceae bacterium]|nr:dihydrodipicolinate synthase family protein [Bryobacteraceae bacterium]